MAKLFGGKDPFDDPFFTQPFGSFFGGSLFDRPFGDQPGSNKQITIEELNPDDDSAKTSDGGKELIVQNHKKKASDSGRNGKHKSFVYRRVSYGGLDGMYYTCSEGRVSGGDGVFLAEMKEEDKVIGESLHTISKGIHNKGHSVTNKKNSDGRTDSLQTLHNLNEDELMKFEEDWKVNADKLFPGWNNGFNMLENAGNNWLGWDGFPNWSSWGGWALPSADEASSGAVVPAGGKMKAKKVTRVNIE